MSTPPDRNLALELVRVTEAAAIAAGRWVGRGDKEAADQAAVDAMRLMLDTVEMDGVVETATARRGPHALPTYAIQLADDFHRFYHQHRVLESGAAEGFRLGLCRATQAVIARALDLVGVEAPERM